MKYSQERERYQYKEGIVYKFRRPEKNGRRARRKGEEEAVSRYSGTVYDSSLTMPVACYDGAIYEYPRVYLKIPGRRSIILLSMRGLRRYNRHFSVACRTILSGE